MKRGLRVAGSDGRGTVVGVLGGVVRKGIGYILLGGA